MAARTVKLGPLTIGGGAPVVVQTMLNADPRDPQAVLAQILSTARRGAEVVRLAVPDQRSAEVLREVVPRSPVPLVADIHFDHRLALAALKAGVAGLRLNPGNIGEPRKIRLVAEAAGRAGAAIRVGVNAGSLDKKMLALHGRGPEAMVASALAEAALIEETGFANLKVSLKASSVQETAAAVRLFARRSDLPQHLGVTEAGDRWSGAVKSAVGLGLLLAEGLGDTIRVSLTAPPEDEVDCAWEILKALGLRRRGPEFVSCPTCGRCEIDLPALLADVKRRLAFLKSPLTVAVMGCVVNGPGEASQADLGVAGGRGRGRLFVKGRSVGSFPYEKLAQALEDKARELEELAGAGSGVAPR
ncbi:MAG: flavodoxin-dependent (E)-4-hydroxy-3-methylbut-2-enyl-diphosphate synthase [Deltaproteobacteria bacterium]|jgi:(E)-4-hydroxy-3-methylbut-2-enyl-diphosphate synthase|nr:flavodoxin-dependent (E)-4-hydroxy-3-methylbut-2-enyl-diphosphate synthase [Deltaproteobacteria bacterium]